ncbi:Protein of unknown function DUF4786 [Cinara cedri]|uniref:Uncharacterized protein n=1 Tax=Cinara cedri TaxID=506608 RepID=A0A5E4M0B9_9HEMI|nr:Protein of unknown function DUF4786 [Cinara cedri]
MRKFVLLLSAAAAMTAVFGVVPATASKRHREESGVLKTADENGNEVAAAGTGSEAAIAEHDGGKRYRYAAAATAAEEPQAAAAAAAEHAPKPKQHASKQHNAKLLNKLGMKRVRTSGGPNHHRKRLASQSRSKYPAGGADGKGASDSQMFVIKLPPHAHFYDDGSQRLQHRQQPYKNVNTVPVGFVSNGKPAKVYHWNLPTIKHALHNGGARYKGANEPQQQQQQQMHHLVYNHQAAGDFAAEHQAAASSKIVPRRTLYYKPRASGKPVKKSFVNNGKPNGFYVVSTKNAAAMPQYHKIVKAYYGNGDD